MARGFNRIPQFRHMLEQKKLNCSHQLGRFLVNRMDYYVPVDTGYLKSNNEYIATANRLRLINDTPYAGYVHQGTSRMVARPFMTQALFNHLSEIKSIVRSVYRI